MGELGWGSELAGGRLVGRVGGLLYTHARVTQSPTWSSKPSGHSTPGTTEGPLGAVGLNAGRPRLGFLAIGGLASGGLEEEVEVEDEEEEDEELEEVSPAEEKGSALDLAFDFDVDDFGTDFDPTDFDTAFAIDFGFAFCFGLGLFCELWFGSSGLGL